MKVRRLSCDILKFGVSCYKPTLDSLLLVKGCIVVRLYAQNQKRYGDPKTNIGYKNTNLLVGPGVLATNQFSARCRLILK